jgi:hypothetical protein
MLGITPQPAMAATDDLLAEACTLDVVAFGKELMITSRNGATFLIADARSRTPESICVWVGSEGPIAPGTLADRLLGGAGQDSVERNPAEFTMPGCKAWLEDDALLLDLPEIGPVYVAHIADAGATAPAASLFTASGEVATIGDLLDALSRPVPQPVAPEQADSRPPAAERVDDLPPTSLPSDVGPSARAVPLTIGLPDALAAAPDRVVLVVVRGLPEGASLSAGAASGDGSWLLSPQDLPGLSLTPARDWAADLSVAIAAIAIASPEGELTATATTVSVPWRRAGVDPAPSPSVAPAPSFVGEPTSSIGDPAPSAVDLACSPAAGPARTSIPLDLTPEFLSEGGAFDALIVRDLPAGVSLSAGTYDPAMGVWVLLPHQLAGLSVITSGGWGEDFSLSLTGVSLRADARPRLLARVPVTIRH